jgi:ribosomal-protein-alanine N-acetyltransferase
LTTQAKLKFGGIFKMQIRAYTPLDKEKILELLRLNTPGYFSPNEEKDLVNYLEHHLEYYYVIEIGNEVLGCGGINLVDDGITAKLSWDIIHPKTHGKGLGTELTKHRIKKVKEMDHIKILVVRTTQLAYKFYGRFGLKLKTVEKDYWEKGFDLYYMEADLDSVKTDL